MFTQSSQQTYLFPNDSALGSGKFMAFKSKTVPLKEIEAFIGCFGGNFERTYKEYPKQLKDGPMVTVKVIALSTANKDGEMRTCAAAIFYAHEDGTTEFVHQLITTNDPFAIDNFTRVRGLAPLEGPAVQKCMEHICFLGDKTLFAKSTTYEEMRQIALTSPWLAPSVLAEILGELIAHIEKPEPVEASKISKSMEAKDIEDARKKAKKEADAAYMVLLREVLAGMTDDDFAARYLSFLTKIEKIPTNLTPGKFKELGRCLLFNKAGMDKWNLLQFMLLAFRRAELYNPEANPIESALALLLPRFCHETSPDDRNWALVIEEGKKLHDFCQTVEGIEFMLESVEAVSERHAKWISKLSELCSMGTVESHALIIEHLTVAARDIGSKLGLSVQLLRLVWLEEIAIPDEVMAHFIAEFEKVGISVKDFRGVELEASPLDSMAVVKSIGAACLPPL